MRLLVCEDNKLVIKTLSVVLTRNGFEVDLAEDGNKAFEVLSRSIKCQNERKWESRRLGERSQTLDEGVQQERDESHVLPRQDHEDQKASGGRERRENHLRV